MLAATRRWFKRNRTPLLVTAGVLTAGYIAGQYVITKIQEARRRMGEDRIAQENLKRRFQQNQDDCTYTVQALLPTVREEIMGALAVEQITEELQRERQERLTRLGQSEAGSTEYPSVPPSVVDDQDGGKSVSSGSYIHASRMVEGNGAEGSQARRPKRSKAQLWQEMKINSITRTLTLMYTLSILTLLTRIQLNLLGRRTYLSSVVALANPPVSQQGSTISLENKDDDNYDVYGNDFETNRKYLTFSWWLLHRGSKQIMDRIMAIVKDVFGRVNIREDLTLERLAELIMTVRKRIEGGTEEERLQMKWLPYLLPPREEESLVIREAGLTSDSDDNSPSPDNRTEGPLSTNNQINASLRRLLDETADLIDSPSFTSVLTKIMDTTYSQLVDYRIATEAYKLPYSTAPGYHTEPQPYTRIKEVQDEQEELERVKLAHILPIFCKQAHVIAAGGSPPPPEVAMVQDPFPGPEAKLVGNEYLAAIDQTYGLEAFSAVIYSSNFEFEIAEKPEPEDADKFAPQGQVEILPDMSEALQDAWRDKAAKAREVDEALAQLSEDEAPVYPPPPQHTSQVPETRPDGAADATLGGAETTGEDQSAPNPDAAAQQGAGASGTDKGLLESAWQKAIAEEKEKEEQGKATGGEPSVPVAEDE
jgi:peroxin-3